MSDGSVILHRLFIRSSKERKAMSVFDPTAAPSVKVQTNTEVTPPDPEDTTDIEADDADDTEDRDGNDDGDVSE